jgi:hypothetical protein
MNNTEVTRKIRGLDDESAIAIYRGLNLTQMCKMFEMERRDLRAKLEEYGVQPSGMHEGYPIYKLKDVMPLVVKPLYDIETYLRRMNAAELPKHLSKEFWAGQRSKQEFQLKAGELWPTEKVVERVGELFKLFKMSLLLATDTVERQVELTPKMRSILQSIHAATLYELHEKVKKNFGAEPIEQEPEDDDAL